VVNGQGTLVLVQELEGLEPQFPPTSISGSPRFPCTCSLGFSSDGRIAAAKGQSIQILMANQQGKVQEVQELEGHTQKVTSMAFNFNGGGLLASATDTRERRVRIWAADEQGRFEQVQELKCQRSIFHAIFDDIVPVLAFSHDGRCLASALERTATIFIWGVKERADTYPYI